MVDPRDYFKRSLLRFKPAKRALLPSKDAILIGRLTLGTCSPVKASEPGKECGV